MAESITSKPIDPGSYSKPDSKFAMVIVFVVAGFVIVRRLAAQHWYSEPISTSIIITTITALLLPPLLHHRTPRPRSTHHLLAPGRIVVDVLAYCY